MAFLHDDRYERLILESVNTDEGRKYKTPDGNMYTSVTTALGNRPEKKASLQAWRDRVGHEEANKIGTRAARQGTELHAVVERYLKNHDDFKAKVMPNVLFLFNNIRPILDSSINTIYMQESSMYSDRYKLAGTVDCIADFKGKLSIIDFKSSAKQKRREWIEDYFLQTAAYAYMFNELYGEKIEQTVVLITGSDGSMSVFYDEPEKHRTHDFFTDRLQCSGN